MAVYRIVAQTVSGRTRHYVMHYMSRRSTRHTAHFTHKHLPHSIPYTTCTETTGSAKVLHLYPHLHIRLCKLFTSRSPSPCLSSHHDRDIAHPLNIHIPPHIYPLALHMPYPHRLHPQNKYAWCPAPLGLYTGLPRARAEQLQLGKEAAQSGS